VTRLPTVHPLPDSEQFADAARQSVANYLGLPLTDATMKEKVEYLNQAFKLKMKSL
jgi:hypothetical protein